MADQSFDGVVVATGVQTAFGTPNATISGATGALTSVAHGIILGDKESGDAESGIAIPNFEQIARLVADVPASFTKSAQQLQKVDVTSFAVTFPLAGNGETFTGAAREAQFAGTHEGIEAVLESMGLIGAAGTSPVEEYTPRHTASAGGTTIYSTWKIWHGPLEMVFSDCLIDNAAFVFTPGGNCLITADIAVGTYDHTVDPEVDSFPSSTDYGSQATLAAPTIEGVAFTWGMVKGFENLTINVVSDTEKFGDSNVDVSGERQAQTGRSFTVSGTLYIDDSDPGFHIDQLRSATAPTANLSFQVGTVTASGIYNAYKIECNALQPESLKYNRIGSTLVVEINNAICTGLTAGSEFKLSMN
jgi:hypothetical protein